MAYKKPRVYIKMTDISGWEFPQKWKKRIKTIDKILNIIKK